MYCAEYKLDTIKVKQAILKIDVLKINKNIEIYNFCLNEILILDKSLYENIGFRVTILNGLMELLLFSTTKNEFVYFEKIKNKFLEQFSNEVCMVTLPNKRNIFDNLWNLKFHGTISKLENASYYIGNNQIGIDFRIGTVIEQMIDISSKRKWDFTYQFQLQPYDFISKKELERYAKKYILRLEDEVYMPTELKSKLHSVVNGISSMDFFIDELFVFNDETKEFYEMILSNEFVLNLSLYGFNELSLETNSFVEDLLLTGLSSLSISDVTELNKIFSLVSRRELKDFFLKESRSMITQYSKNNIDKNYDIFISYSTKNTEEAELVCFELEKEGYKCWYAPRDILPSTQYPQEIIRGIKSAKYFILLHSQYSTISRYVVREVTKALSYEKIILPILLDNAKPSENMEFILETCQWIDASQNNFNDKLNELKEILLKLK